MSKTDPFHNNVMSIKMPLRIVLENVREVRISFTLQHKDYVLLSKPQFANLRNAFRILFDNLKHAASSEK
jgi:hypothetical protein